MNHIKLLKIILAVTVALLTLAVESSINADDDVLIVGFFTTFDNNISKPGLYPQVYYLNGNFISLGLDEMMRDNSPRAQISQKYRKLNNDLLNNYKTYDLYKSRKNTLIGNFKIESVASDYNCYEDATQPFAQGTLNLIPEYKRPGGWIDDYAIYSTRSRNFIPVNYEADLNIQSDLLDFSIPLIKKDILKSKNRVPIKNIDEIISKKTILGFTDKVDIDNLKSYINKFRLRENGEDVWSVHLTLPDFHFNYIVRQTKNGYQVIDKWIIGEEYSEGKTVLKRIQWIIPFDQNKTLMLMLETGLDIHVRDLILYEWIYDKISDTYKKRRFPVSTGSEC